MDVGPSTIAIVDDEQARLLTFCDELADKDREIRLLQRAMERSRRANNPENYNEDGTIKKGKKQWKFSRRYRELQAKKAELERCLAEHRRTLHGQLSNEIIRRGKFVRSEKVSYLSFQKNFGKSVGRRAPGMLMGKVCTQGCKCRWATGRDLNISDGFEPNMLLWRKGKETSESTSTCVQMRGESPTRSLQRVFGETRA